MENVAILLFNESFDMYYTCLQYLRFARGYF